MTNKVLPSGEVGQDVLIKSDDGQSIGYQTIDEVRAALGSFKDVGAQDVVPVMVGGGTAVLGTLLIRKFAKPSSVFGKYASAFGAGLGVLASVPLHFVYGGKGVTSAALASLVVGGGFLAFDKLSTMEFFQPKEGEMGLIDVQRSNMGRLVATGGNAPQVRATANVPGGIQSAMQVADFGGNASY